MAIFKIADVSFDVSQESTEKICDIEDTLHFEGIITDYSGYGYKTTPVILLVNDSLVYIPRYNTDFALYVGDTIKKVSGSHVYYINRNFTHRNITGKPIDTISFNCK